MIASDQSSPSTTTNIISSIWVQNEEILDLLRKNTCLHDNEVGEDKVVLPKRLGPRSNIQRHIVKERAIN